MAPQQHFVISWVLSNLNYESRRDRIVTTICGVIADIDGLGMILDEINRDGSYHYYLAWHRKLGHNILVFAGIALATYFICRRKILPAIVAMMAYLVHIFLDMVGSAGPDGSIWSVYPLWPFSDYEIRVDWQWGLNDWKNTLITAVFIAVTFIIAHKKKRSFLEVFSSRLDGYCIGVVEGIFRWQK